MVKILNSAFALAVLFILSQCTSTPKENTTSAVEEEAIAEVEMEPEITRVQAVCIWDKVSVRQEADAKGKWITSLSLGESLTSLGIDSTVENKTYTKVLLNDENSGWAIKDFIVTNAKSAVILKETDLYSRPDLLTKTDKKFSKMDIIASTSEQDDWIKVRGKRSEGKWIDEGWIKSANLSYASVDVATAKFALEAYEIDDEEMRAEAIKEIIDNSDLSDSKFIAELVVTLTDLSEPATEEVMEEMVEEEVAEDSIQ